MQNTPSKISWLAPEHEYHQKSQEWFWALGIIVLAMILAAVVLKNFLFAILIVLCGFCVALYGARKPKTVKFEVGPRGIDVDGRLYDYDSISHFWIEYNPPHRKELMLEFKKKFSLHLIIMLDQADPELVRDYLLQYLKEKRVEETLTASLARMLKF